MEGTVSFICAGYCEVVVACGINTMTPLVQGILQCWSTHVSVSLHSNRDTESQLEQNNTYFLLKQIYFLFWIDLSNILMRCYLSVLSRVGSVVEVTLTLPSSKALLLNAGLCLDLQRCGSHPREPCRIQEKCSVARRLGSAAARLFSHPCCSSLTGNGASCWKCNRRTLVSHTHAKENVSGQSSVPY